MRKQAGAADHLGLNPSAPATCFPTAVTVACSWDPALGEEIGKAMGTKLPPRRKSPYCWGRASHQRSPLCDRDLSTSLRGPLPCGQNGSRLMRGIRAVSIAACPKHFAVNSQELRRQASDSVLDERTLREIYLTGFEIVWKESAPKPSCPATI